MAYRDEDPEVQTVALGQQLITFFLGLFVDLFVLMFWASVRSPAIVTLLPGAGRP